MSFFLICFLDGFYGYCCDCLTNTCLACVYVVGRTEQDWSRSYGNDSDPARDNPVRINSKGFTSSHHQLDI